ncbi:MoaB/Mog domain-containing protein [Mycotypha africana]|uniref:MoaB/Mog domain-containing protein n=1 Tax=Mycotypha africana TaxID=64632 RepID=UPI0023001D4D|nr:MoaB/Mog domain-containing protein [Mycotypha africana]KAI8971634.1 MoaB/Mog domain-containing protein [Mycotypha africana]
MLFFAFYFFYKKKIMFKPFLARPFSITSLHRYSRQIMSQQKSSFSAACCIIGDEILNGKTRDSNAHFLAKYLFRLGIDLKRIETIPDEYDAIEETIKRLSSHHDFVFTSGGIGPTHDDITYSALAKAFQLPLQLDKETCLRMERSAAMTYNKKPDQPQWTLTEARKRMAIFPEPSKKLRMDEKEDELLWVPVVVVNDNIHVLPGIPKLFESLLERVVRPHLESIVFKTHPQSYHRIQIATKLPEGEIAPFLTELQKSCQEKQIKIGSYPNWGKGKDGARVVVSVVGKDLAHVDSVSDEVLKGVGGWILEEGKL